MSLEYRLLGPLEVRVDGRMVPIGSARQRVLLAALLVDANHTVSYDRLINRIWADDIPASARNTLHSYVMRLRRALGTSTDTGITTRTDGYAIETRALDTTRFESLVHAARGTDPDTAATLLRQALDLWRGDPLSDVPSPALRREFTAVWRERRLAALELRVDADLRVGRHQDVTAELADLTARHPLRERFWAQRMLALHRSGRTAEALQCYAVVRRRLADELGVDPGTELRDLHQAILTEDPSLATPRPSEPPRERRNDLPGDIPDFVGRTDEFGQLLALLPTPGESARTVVITAIDGMAGIGKTTLAVHAAHQLTDRYPDGQICVDLRAHTEHQEPLDPITALDMLLRAVGVPAARVPTGLDERAAAWRAAIAHRKVLLVLDNAVSAAQVRPLLPGSPTCLVLITSRRRLADLDTAVTLSLDVLPEPDALALFASVVGAARADHDPDATSAVLQLCGHLPLAIRIAGGRLRSRPAWPVRALADRLRDETRRDDELTIGDRGVTAALDLSYRRLTEPQQRLFALLGDHPGLWFDAYQAAALGDLPLADTERLLGELVDVHLLDEPLPGRYRQHDLVHQYAHGRNDLPEPIRRDAVGRLLDYFRYVAGVVYQRLGHDVRRTLPAEQPPGPVPDITNAEDAIRWAETELRNLLATIKLAARGERPAQARELALRLFFFFERRGHTDDWISCLQTAAAVSDRTADEAQVLLELGLAYHAAGRYTDGIAVLADALAISREIGDVNAAASVFNNMGNTHMRMGRLHDAVDDYRQALAGRRRAGDFAGTAVVLSNMCIVYERLDRFDESMAAGLEALDRYRDAANQRGQAMAHNNLAVTCLRMGRLTDALGHGRHALRLVRVIADRVGEAATSNTLGRIHGRLGDHRTALAQLRQALAMAQEIGEATVESDIRAALAELAGAETDEA